MAATYPGGVKAFSTKVNGVDTYDASHINDLQLEIAALETELVNTRVGWLRVATAATYASATSLTIAGDFTALFKIGAKFRCTNSGTKFGYVLSSSFAGGNTTVNLMANSDYSLANAAISNVDISFGTPPDFPAWLSWTPAWTSLTVTGSPIYSGKFNINNRVFSPVVFIQANGGTTAATYGTTIVNNLPVVVAGLRCSGIIFDTASGLIKGGAQYIPTLNQIYPSSWTATGNDLSISGSFQI